MFVVVHGRKGGDVMVEGIWIDGDKADAHEESKAHCQGLALRHGMFVDDECETHHVRYVLVNNESDYVG